MPGRVTVLKSLRLYTTGQHWRVDVEVWASDLRIYRSLGTRVIVCHLERITSIWGGTQTEWEEEPADLIRIRNVYSGTGVGVATREHEWHVSAKAELREWSTTDEIHLLADGVSKEESASPLDIYRVESTVTVKIGDETLMGVLSASIVAREQAAMAGV